MGDPSLPPGVFIRRSVDEQVSRKAVRYHGVSVMLCGSESSDVVAEVKDDRRLQRRQQTRGVHRKRRDKVSLLGSQVETLSKRAKHARRRGCTESLVLSGTAKELHRKSDRLRRRFHMPIPAQDGAEHNGEE